MTALLTLTTFIGAWFADAVDQLTRDYGAFVGVYAQGSNVTRCGPHDCPHTRYERAHDVSWITAVDTLGRCDRFSRGPWVELQYRCTDHPCEDIGDGVTVYRCCATPTIHHAVYGASGEARAVCWAS